MAKQNPHAFVGNEGEARHSAIDAALGFLVTHYKEHPSLENDVEATLRAVATMAV